MTPQTALQAAAVLQAFAEGKKIEQRGIYGFHPTAMMWHDYDGGPFNLGAMEYRVKPEPPKPREWHGVVVGRESRPSGNIFITVRISGEAPATSQIVRVREVLDAPEPPVRPLRKPPEGIADPPDGWEYFAEGRVKGVRGVSLDVAAWCDRQGWNLGGWIGNDDGIHYALRIGSAVHAENFNKEKA